METKVHEGRNVKRFREMLGIKQEVLASQLGEGWTQKKVSMMESMDILEPDILYMVAKVLNVPEEAIRNFDEEKVVNIISNTFHDTKGLINYHPTFNTHPVDKLLQLHEEKIALYERMLKEKDDMMMRLERLISEK